MNNNKLQADMHISDFNKFKYPPGGIFMIVVGLVIFLYWIGHVIGEWISRLF